MNVSISTLAGNNQDSASSPLLPSPIRLNGAMKKNAEGKTVLKEEVDHIGIWREMEKLVDEGKIRVVI